MSDLKQTEHIYWDPLNFSRFPKIISFSGISQIQVKCGSGHSRRRRTGSWGLLPGVLKPDKRIKLEVLSILVIHAGVAPSAGWEHLTLYFQKVEISFIVYSLYNLVWKFNCISTYQELTDKMICLGFWVPFRLMQWKFFKLRFNYGISCRRSNGIARIIRN